MNMAFLISYCYEKKKNFLKLKNLRYPFYKYFFFDFIFIKSNDFSDISFYLQNFFNFLSFQDNILFEIKRNFIKKEILIFLKEIFWINFMNKKFKNFNLWHQINWLNKKESFNSSGLSEFFFWQYIFFDPKNFHKWSHAHEKIFFNKIYIWRKIVLVEILDFFDLINYCNWNLKYLFYLFNCVISKNFSKILFFENKKLKLKTVVNFLSILTINLKILNSKIIVFLIVEFF